MKTFRTKDPLRWIIALCILIFVTACAGGISPEEAFQEEPADNELVCIEIEAATLFSMFSGTTRIKKIVFPKDLQEEVSTEELLTMANQCFTGADQAILLEAIRGYGRQ